MKVKKKVKEIIIQANHTAIGNNNTYTNNKGDRNNNNINKQQKQVLTLEAIINPKEVLLYNAILIELSQIIDKVLSSRHFPVMRHIVSGYISLSKILLQRIKA